MSDRIAGLVLAAGRSRRYEADHPKLVASYQGRALVQHAIDATSDLDAVVVVLGDRAAEVGSAISSSRVGIVMVDPGHGQSVSLHAGLAAVPDDCAAVVVVLGDQPGVSSAHVDRAVAAWRQGPSPIVRARYDDGPGHPVVLGRQVFDLLDEGSGGDHGARELMRRHPELVADVVFEGLAPIDVDSADDLARLVEGDRHSRR